MGLSKARSLVLIRFKIGLTRLKFVFFVVCRAPRHQSIFLSRTTEKPAFVPADFSLVCEEKERLAVFQLVQERRRNWRLRYLKIQTGRHLLPPLSADPSRRRFVTMVREVKTSSLNPGMLGEGSDLYLQGYEIEGLRTQYVIWRENYLDDVNRTVVRLEYQVPEDVDVDLNIYRSSFPVVGGMTVQNLLELVSIELQDTDVRPVTFSVDGKVLAGDCLFSVINKQYMCKDGFISLVCVTQSVEVCAEEEPVEDLY